MSHMNECPHCGAEMKPIRTPMDSSWGGEIHHICFNDECVYFIKSWDSLENQGVQKTGYRCRVDPRGYCGPAPVWSPEALKDLVLTHIDGPEATRDHFSPEIWRGKTKARIGDFYEAPRFVDHLDSLALSTVESLYARLIPENAKVLDLMAGPDSHLGKARRLSEVIGLGLNKEELEANPALTDHVMSDVNTDPELPFEDNTFDVVVNTVSVDYMTQPIEVFREVARVLKPSGLFIVVFSNRMFPPKAVNIWKNKTERQRVDLVRRYFSISQEFIIDGYVESAGKPRPKDDKYYHLGIPSDPIYAVWGRVMK